MKDPKKTDFNKKVISEWTESDFVKWWKLHKFDGDAKEWFKKITGKVAKKPE